MKEMHLSLDFSSIVYYTVLCCIMGPACNVSSQVEVVGVVTAASLAGPGQCI